jgi:hypothetical protein
VVLIFLAGILEFGALLFNKMEIETGLRDAARYLARCTGAQYGCGEDLAKQIAVYGSVDGTVPRVTGWSVDDIVITVSEPIDGVDEEGSFLYRRGESVVIVRASTSIDYPGGSLLGLLGIPLIEIDAYHEERYLGW